MKLLPAFFMTAALVPIVVAPHHDRGPAEVIVAWNQVLLDALTTAQAAPPPAMRAGAIVAVSVFDAVDGVTAEYRPYAVTGRPPRDTSAPAAAAAAAHRSLSVLFPAQRATFDARLAATLAGLPERDRATGAVDRGVAWGVTVADTVLALRADDGFTAVPPTYSAGSEPGRWQPTPPAFPAAPAFRQFATMRPWTLRSPAQFRPPAPPALTGARYARDLAEVRALGGQASTGRSAFDTQTAQFWQSAPPIVLWDPVADTLITGHHLGLTAAARLLAHVNLAMADTVIAVWNAKNVYDTWRPVTAIQRTDPAWQPLLATPAFQEYPAGHPAVSQSAAAVLAQRFGDRTRYTLTSPGMPGVTRTLPSFSAGVAQTSDARVFGGIHFRFACDAATGMGRAVAAHVTATTLRRSSG
ncbi:vanadium-dependent haloperoxidase [Dactylosporangium sp. NPDC051541]|uniref:vanadium-dependent haloperoxidase n=1 Tax=Dactylosporangium sp. NPDC051541 TaxID=3363977 RepID=UPI00379BAE35